MLSSVSRPTALEVLNGSWVIMIEDGFRIMLSKFSDDARREQHRHRQREQQVRERHILSARLHNALKRVFGVLALIGVGFGLYYGHSLGMLMGEMHYSSSAETDPSLRGIPEVNAKRLRKMQELANEHNDDYKEVEQLLDGTK